MRKLSAVIFSFFVLVSVNTQAQQSHPKKWQLVQIGLGIVGNEDMFNAPKAEIAEELGAQPEQHPDLKLLSPDSKTSSYGSGLQVNFTFAPNDRLGDTRLLKQSLDLGLTVLPSKEVMVTYEDGDWSDNDYTWIGYCDFYSEIDFNVGYKLRASPHRSFDFYAGLDLQAGRTTGNTMLIFVDGIQDLRYDRASTSFLRATVLLGTEISVFPRISTFLNIRFGKGKSWMPSSSYAINSTGVSFGLKYNVNDLFKAKKEQRGMLKEKINSLLN